MNASRPSEDPPVRGENVKTFSRWDNSMRIIQNLSMALKWVPRCTVVTLLGQEYNNGEKPTVMLYTYIN